MKQFRAEEAGWKRFDHQVIKRILFFWSQKLHGPFIKGSKWRRGDKYNVSPNFYSDHHRTHPLYIVWQSHPSLGHRTTSPPFNLPGYFSVQAVLNGTVRLRGQRFFTGATCIACIHDAHSSYKKDVIGWNDPLYEMGMAGGCLVVP